MPIELSQRITLGPTSLLSTGSAQSLVIALLRGLAALQVALAHLRAELFPSLRGMADPPAVYQALAFATGFAHQAVVVFFVISGWLVGGSLLNKLPQPESMKSYAIDRTSRLWTVLIPTFLLMYLSAHYMDRINMLPSNFVQENEYSAISFLGNLLGLQTIAVPNFGHNYALWSLANETWYYLLFPLVLLIYRCKSAWRKISSALGVTAIALLLPMSILIYFLLWLLGAGFSQVRVELNISGRLVLLLCCATLSIYFRLNGSNADLVVASFLQDLLCSVPLVLLLSTLLQPVPIHSAALLRIRSAANMLSEFSFTLYVTHVPAIEFLRHIGRSYFGRDTLSPYVAFDYAIYFGIAGSLVALAYLMYTLFEANTFIIRRYLKVKLLQVPATNPSIAALPFK